jgi:hypothetical protein
MLVQIKTEPATKPRMRFVAVSGDDVHFPPGSRLTKAPGATELPTLDRDSRAQLDAIGEWEFLDAQGCPFRVVVFPKEVRSLSTLVETKYFGGIERRPWERCVQILTGIVNDSQCTDALVAGMTPQRPWPVWPGLNMSIYGGGPYDQ